MSKAEAQLVMNQTGDNEKMAELVRMLRGKGDKEFDTFCEMLRKSNYDVWANELQKQAYHFQFNPQHFSRRGI